MTKVQIYSFLAEHCVKKDVAWLVAQSTEQWKEKMPNPTAIGKGR